MSKNKIALSLVVAGILGASSALAETSGAFVGLQVGYGGLEFKGENDSNYLNLPTKGSGSISAGGSRYGFVAGYKQFFTPEFGARYYASFDLGTDFTGEYVNEVAGNTFKVNSTIITANADALYNFISSNNLDLGAFLGLSLGYAHHTVKAETEKGIAFKYLDMNPSGFDLGINFGVRTNIAQNHGIELYSRFGVLQQEKELKETYSNINFYKTATYKASQPYQVGLRYSFSF